MSWTLNDLQAQIAIELDQSATPATEGGTDWNIRTTALNRALFDWAESGEWRALLKVHNGLVSTSSANASYALPSNFKKLDGFPRIVADGTTAYDFPAVSPSDNRRYTDTDKFVNVLGNDKDNKVMFIHGSTLPSGASVQFTYWASPVSLASASNVTEIPDPTFLVQRALYYLYKGREDGRFPEAKVESDRILARMIENENTLGISSVNRSVQVGKQSFPNFRVGQDG